MMNIIKFILISFLWACAKDNNEDFKPKACLGQVEVLPNDLSCERWDSIYLNMVYCIVYDAGKFNLDDESKEFMPQFCEVPGKLLTYKNKFGDTILLEVLSKKYYTSIRASEYIMNCTNDSLQKSAYCYRYEAIDISLESIDHTLHISVEISLQPDYDDPLSGKVSDYIYILRRISQHSFVPEFYAVITRRNSSHSNDNNFEFYNSLQINNSTYYNVLSYNYSWSPGSLYKYYYNKQYGLIAFKDSLGMYWNLIR
jgi:hypothetical protein